MTAEQLFLNELLLHIESGLSKKDLSAFVEQRLSEVNTCVIADVTNRNIKCIECKHYSIKVINKTGGTAKICRAKDKDPRAIVDLTPDVCNDYVYGW